MYKQCHLNLAVPLGDLEWITSGSTKLKTGHVYMHLTILSHITI